MKLENSKVYNFQNAFSGMRYPLKSNKKSDSIFGYCSIYEINDLIYEFVSEHYTDDKFEKMFNYYLNNCIIRFYTFQAFFRRNSRIFCKIYLKKFLLIL